TGRAGGGELLDLPAELTPARVRRRQSLRQAVDAVRRELDEGEAPGALDAFEQQAVEMVLGGQAREAFDLAREPEWARERYGKHLWLQQALLARRLVER